MADALNHYDNDFTAGSPAQQQYFDYAYSQMDVAIQATTTGDDHHDFLEHYCPQHLASHLVEFEP